MDAGGHQLHIYCTGKGSPIVVLEAGTGSMSSAWGWVQPEVAKTTRVCSYDRAGLGWSEAGDGLLVASRVPEELRVLLDRSNEIGPIVLVGHELGALYARMYAARFARDTAALVLIDDPTTGRSSAVPVFPSAWPWLARVGILRLSGRLSSLASGLPAGSADAMRSFLNRPDHLTRSALELSQFTEVEDHVRELSLPPEIAIADISIGTHERPAMIVTREDAAKVVQSIQAAVERVREDEESARRFE